MNKEIKIKENQLNINQLIEDTINKKIKEINNPSIYEDGKTPPKPSEFFKYWMKRPLFPLQQEAIDNILVYKNEKGEIHWNTQFNEAYLLWGEGGGKDFVSVNMWVYTIFFLMHLKDAPGYFGQENSRDPIELVNVSFDEEQARDVFFKRFKIALSETVDPSTGKRWFEERGMAIKETSKLQMIEFPKRIIAYSLNSKEYKAEGKNVLMSLFDEMAAFKVEKAEELYKNLKGTMRTRFAKQHKFIAISYKRDDYDYMMVRWEKTKNNPRVFRSGPYATWEVNLTKHKEDFADAYLENPEDAERRLENKGSTLQGGYFKYKEEIQIKINKHRVSPIIEETIPMRNIIGIRFKDGFVGIPGKKYVSHIDLAKGKDPERSGEKADCAGWALGHLEITDEKFPQVVIDLMVQLKADPGKEIVFDHIRQLIYKLIEERKFNITKVTLDGYESTDFTQMLKSRGIAADELSVDRNTGAYDTMKSLIYNGRLDYYNYPVFIRECEELKLIDGKVDHPAKSMRRALEEKDEKGSKDVSDAVAAVCKSLLEEEPAKKVTWFGLVGTPEDRERTKDPNAREYGSVYERVSDDEDD